MMHKKAIEKIQSKRKEQIEEFGHFLVTQEVTRCKRCGKILIDTYSIRRKLGYKCWRKVRKEQEMSWPGRNTAFKTVYKEE